MTSPQSLVSSIAIGRLTENMYQQNPERLRKTTDRLSEYTQVCIYIYIIVYCFTFALYHTNPKKQLNHSIVKKHEEHTYQFPFAICLELMIVKFIYVISHASLYQRLRGNDQISIDNGKSK